MIWHDLRDSNDPELDVLAERFHLHPLHVEDCRHRGQRAKVEEGGVVPPLDLERRQAALATAGSGEGGDGG